MIGIVKSIYDEVVKASELLRDKGQINFKNDYEDCFTLSYNRYVGVTYSNPWEMPSLPHPQQNWREVWIKMPDPPEDFEFNIHYAMPFAVQALKTDRELRLARQIFVPSRMSVYNFWRKYFWYIELMKCQVIDEFQLADATDWDAQSQPEPELEPGVMAAPPNEANTQQSRPPRTSSLESDVMSNGTSSSPPTSPSMSMSNAPSAASPASFKNMPKFYEQARVAVIREHLRKKLNAANALPLEQESGRVPARRRKVSFNDSLNYIPDNCTLEQQQLPC